mmetsp:Transcript_9496/g.17614  ORF Transcript_9496/g.17614 Transcript_9496/m.17614 type:complete len:138 (+) Transcript_9496:57-470(+)
MLQVVRRFNVSHLMRRTFFTSSRVETFLKDMDGKLSKLDDKVSRLDDKVNRLDDKVTTTFNEMRKQWLDFLDAKHTADLVAMKEQQKEWQGFRDALHNEQRPIQNAWAVCVVLSASVGSIFTAFLNKDRILHTLRTV